MARALVAKELARGAAQCPRHVSERVRARVLVFGSIEFWFVVEPTQDKLAELRQKPELGGLPHGWPQETKWHEQQETDDPALARGKRREGIPLSSYLAEQEERNGRLRDMGFAGISRTELIAGRLYTGPMFQKYNRVLREIGAQQIEAEKTSGGVVALDELEKRLEDKLVRLSQMASDPRSSRA